MKFHLDIRLTDIHGNFTHFQMIQTPRSQGCQVGVGVLIDASPHSGRGGGVFMHQKRFKSSAPERRGGQVKLQVKLLRMQQIWLLKLKNTEGGQC